MVTDLQTQPDDEMSATDDSGLIERIKSEGVKDAERCIKVCDLMTTGKSMRQACEALDLKHNTFLKKAIRSQTLGDQYARARRVLFDVRADKMLEEPNYEDFIGPDGRVDNGKVTLYKAFKDNEKWTMSKLDPKRFGDRLDVQGDINNTIIVQKIERVIVDKAIEAKKADAIDIETTIECDSGQKGGQVE